MKKHIIGPLLPVDGNALLAEMDREESSPLYEKNAHFMRGIHQVIKSKIAEGDLSDYGMILSPGSKTGDTLSPKSDSN